MISSPKIFPFLSIIPGSMSGRGAEGADGMVKRRDCHSKGQECSVRRHVSRLWVEDELSCGIKATRALGNEISLRNASLLRSSSLNYFREAVSKDWEFMYDAINIVWLCLLNFFGRRDSIWRRHRYCRSKKLILHTRYEIEDHEVYMSTDHFRWNW